MQRRQAKRLPASSVPATASYNYKYKRRPSLHPYHATHTQTAHLLDRALTKPNDHNTARPLVNNDMSSKNDNSKQGVGGGAAAVAALAVGAVLSYFLWPVAAPAAAVVMMKAPGAGGLLISRVAFMANPQLYFSLLRTAGAAAAVAAFAA